MPSSISSSDDSNAEPTGVGGRWVVRDVPEQPWLVLFVAALAVVAVAVTAWEARARARGYAPTLDDTPNLWASARRRAVGARPEQVVFVGASRTLFDMDLRAFQQETHGPLPVQLATVGSNPLIVLEDLAADPTYAGTTIVGIVPGLLAAAAGPPISTPTKFVAHFHALSVANRMELPLVTFLDERLAFMNEDLTLSALIDATDLPLRAHVYAPKLPGYMYELGRDRQARMTAHVATDPAERHRIQQIWMPLFHGPPKPRVFTDAQWARLLADGCEANLGRLKTAVSRITARGGRVIFSRLPSTGPLLELEDAMTPRSAIWDRILRETGQPGVYFSDHPELSGFECPEWSHLDAESATRYTRHFARLLIQRGLLRSAPP